MIFIQFVVFNAPDKRDDDILGVEEVARRLGLSPSTVRNGRGGVRRIPKARRKPLGWLRRDVDAFVNRPARTSPAQFAARLVEAKGRGRRQKKR